MNNNYRGFRLSRFFEVSCVACTGDQSTGFGSNNFGSSSTHGFDGNGGTAVFC